MNHRYYLLFFSRNVFVPACGLFKLVTSFVLETELRKNFLGNLEAWPGFWRQKLERFSKECPFCWLNLSMIIHDILNEVLCHVFKTVCLALFNYVAKIRISVNAEIFWVRLTVTVLRLVKFYWNICKTASKLCLLCFDAINDSHSGMSVNHFCVVSNLPQKY